MRSSGKCIGSALASDGGSVITWTEATMADRDCRLRYRPTGWTKRQIFVFDEGSSFENLYFIALIALQLLAIHISNEAMAILKNKTELRG